MALVIDTGAPLTHNLPRTEAGKITKYGNLSLEIKNIWKLNNLCAYLSVISAGGVITENFLTHLQKTGLTKNILRVGQKAMLLLTCHTVPLHLRAQDEFLSPD